MQANSFACQAIIVGLFDMLTKKGVLDHSDQFEMRDTVLDLLQRIQLDADTGEKWILDMAQDRVNAMFPSA